MSWFEATNWTANLAKTAKTALKHAQKNIDKVLEIPVDQQDSESNYNGSTSSQLETTIQGETDTFFSIFGVADNVSSSKPSEGSDRASPTSSLNEEPSSYSNLIPSMNCKNSSSNSISLLDKSASTTSVYPISGVTSLHISNDFTTVEDLDIYSRISCSAHRIHDPASDLGLGIVGEGAAETIPEKVSQGRLEIIFQDEEFNKEDEDHMVEVPLDAVSSTGRLEDETIYVDQVDGSATMQEQRLMVRIPSQDIAHPSRPSEDNVIEKFPNTVLCDTVRTNGAYPIQDLVCSINFPVLSNRVQNVADESEANRKMAQLTALLEAREKKLIEMSTHNVRLKEENDNICGQLSELIGLKSKLESIQSEYSATERKLQVSMEEKKSLTEQLHLTKTELSNSLRSKPDSSATQLKEIQCQLEEKDGIIKELMEEGEKLSKQQLQTSNHIKKLKSKQKELETENAHLKIDLENKCAEISTLKSTLTLAEEADQKNVAVIQQLHSTVDTLEKDLLSARSQLEETKLKASTMQSALDSVYKELADLHRQRAHQEGQTQETLLTVQLAAKEELRQALEQHTRDLIQEQQELMNRVEGLQASLNRAENTLKRREDSYKEEIGDYQQRLQDAMTRNEELCQNLTQATRPLLRQNETLQQQLVEQNATFSKLEFNLTKRLQDSMAQLAAAQEKERFATEKLTTLMGKVEALEIELGHFREERNYTAAEANVERRKTREAEEKISLLKTEIQTLRDSTSSELLLLRREKVVFEHQLALEKEQLEMEKRKNLILAEQNNDLQKQFSMKEITHSASETAILHRSDSVNSTASTLNGRWSPLQNSNSSLYDVLRGGSATFLDSLQSQIGMKEGEINHLRSELKQLEISRQKMSEELLRAAERSHQMDELKVHLENVQNEKEDIFKRYNAMLQMYGEKAEELQELRLDYEDMKALYKAQIDALTRQEEPSH